MTERLLAEGLTIFLGAMVSIACALLYFQRVRLERPPIGTFNGRDVAVLMGFIIILPVLYAYAPRLFLTGLLILTFTCAIYLALRPFMRTRYILLLTFPLLAANIWVTQLAQEGWSIGWQVYWLLTNMVVLTASVAVSNLYVQGGMRLRHVAWFGLALGVYDITFTSIIPLTPYLADRFIGQALDPSIGFQMSFFRANIGLGDLLVYCLFTVAAYKGFGRKGAIAAFIIVAIFGAVVPLLAPQLLRAFIRQVGIVVPAQTSFGPAAYLTYRWLRRGAPERSMAEWFKVQAAMGHKIITSTRPAARPVPAPAPALPALAETVVSDVQGTD